MTVPDYETATDPGELLAVARDAVDRALISAFNVHQDLAENGIEPIQTNQYGDTALRADIEAEDAVLQAIGNLRITVFSEEHGVVNLNGDGLQPKLTGVLDGLDGSSVYRRERGTGKYGTMFAIFEGDNPVYDDYLAA